MVVKRRESKMHRTVVYVAEWLNRVFFVVVVESAWSGQTMPRDQQMNQTWNASEIELADAEKHRKR